MLSSISDSMGSPPLDDHSAAMVENHAASTGSNRADPGSIPKSCKVAAGPMVHGRSDLLVQLTMQQKDRIQRATDWLTASGVWEQPAFTNMRYIQEQLHITDAEVSTVFEQAQNIVIQPAIDFLSLPAVRPNAVELKVRYLRQKMGLHDEDIAKCFERIQDTAGMLFFVRQRLSAAADFLANPAVAPRSVELKVEYLRSRLSLSDAEIAEAFSAVAQRERTAEIARIDEAMERTGHVLLVRSAPLMQHRRVPVHILMCVCACGFGSRTYWIRNRSS
jgi:hypothetical protein